MTGVSENCRQTIWVVGYPRSGTVWLAWLLGDALNCPVYPAPGAGREDGEYVTEGIGRPWPWVVRQGHYVVLEREDGIREPQSMTKVEKDRGKVVYAIRDPRDLTVSHAYYWGTTVAEALRDLLSCEFGWHSGWAPHIVHWKREGWDTLVQYRHLRSDTTNELRRVLRELDLPVDRDRVVGAVQRQDFNAKRKHDIEHHKHWARAGYWPAYFTRGMGRRAQAAWGDLLSEFGYTESDDWWQALPRCNVFPEVRR